VPAHNHLTHVLAVLLLAAACGDSMKSRELSDSERVSHERWRTLTSDARHLRWLAPVPVLVVAGDRAPTGTVSDSDVAMHLLKQTRDRVRAWGTSQEGCPTGVGQTPSLATTLDMVTKALTGGGPTEARLAEERRAVAIAEVDGAHASYSPAERRIYISERALHPAGDDAIARARSTTVHELTHALIHQHFGTDRLAAETVDAQLAFNALSEGEATFVAHAVTILGAEGLENIRTDPALRSLFDGAGERFAIKALKGQNAARFSRLRSPFIYVDGAAFAYALVVRGGWAALDEAHRNPPAHTSEILHPETYGAHAPREELALPPIETLDREPVCSQYAGPLGELLLVSTLVTATDDVAHARQLASAMSADEARVWQGHGTARILWRLRFSNSQAANDVVALLTPPESASPPTVPTVVRALESEVWIARGWSGAEDAVENAQSQAP
jgi:hypothetical protein